VKTVGALIAKAKAAPGKLNFGAGTITTRLTGHLFNKAAGVNTVLVPYNGSAEVTQGLLTRSVDFTFDGTSAAASLIQGGKFRVLAKFDERPFPPAPEAPTISTVVKGLDEISVWLGLVAPKGTNPAIVDKLQQEVAKILADPGVKAKADAAGLFPVTTTPSEFDSFIRREAERWSKVVQETGMRYD
jgi:tripartite-type tricarboxylate transporter receptor subunit TctC